MVHQIGGLKFVELPGNHIIELPPLILSTVNNKFEYKNIKTVFEKNDRLIDKNVDPEKIRHFDLALNILNLYSEFSKTWSTGNCIFRWIEQCRTNRNINDPLSPVLAKTWPDNLDLLRFGHLIEAKRIELDGKDIYSCLGIRYMFDQIPPIEYLSSEYLAIQDQIARNNFCNAIKNCVQSDTLLPTERFNFQVIKL